MTNAGSGEPATEPSTKQGHRWQFTAIALIALLVGTVLTLWGSIAWTWSPVDDAGHVLALRTLIDENGLLLGMVNYVLELIRVDLSWGLFRPAYWVYPSLFYLADPTTAHVVRLVMLIVAIAGPLVHFRRQGLRGPALAFAAMLLTGAAAPLAMGLFLVSLQELSGLAFIGLGLLFPNRWVRLTLWTVAAWFKAPFAWILVGLAWSKWHQGERKYALVSAIIGFGTLALAAVFALNGSYSSSYGLDPYMMWHNVKNLLEPVNVVVVIVFLWWLFVTKGRVQRNSDTTIFGVAWLGYTLQLLPWSVTAYYMGPITFLLGLTLVSTLVPSYDAAVTPLEALVGYSLPVVLMTVVVADALTLGLRINDAMRTFEDCLLDRSGTTSILQGDLVYVTTSPEAPLRLIQNLQLRNELWMGNVSLAGQEERVPDYILGIGNLDVTQSSEAQVVCQSTWSYVVATGQQK